MVQKPILIIPAAGLATRLRPLTGSTSKCMIPVNGKPTISYILDQYSHLYDDIIVVHGVNEDVKRYCEKKYPRVTLIKQEEAIGVGDAIMLGLSVVKDQSFNPGKPVTIWLGDTIVLDYKTSFPQSIELVTSEVPDYERWCMIDDSGKMYDKPKEKPPTNKALVGVYTFPEYCYLVSAVIHANDNHGFSFEISHIIEEYDDVVSLVNTNEWYDVGDLPSLYESKARLLTRSARIDNHLSVDTERASITKSGDRIKNEIFWYQNIDNSIAPYIPTIYSFSDNSYEMGYCSGTTLQETFVFEDIRKESISYVLNRVMKAYFSFIKASVKNTEDLLPYNRNFMFDSKIDRVMKYDYDFVSQVEKEEYVKYVNCNHDYLKDIGDLFNVQYIHGDLHFGNIIFDYQTGVIKFIDPRGEWDGVNTTQGCRVYDYAKLLQSFIGDYMWIKTDTQVDESVKNTCIEFFRKEMGLTYNTYTSYVPVLLGSILDFHKDRPDHQKKIWQKTLELIRN